MGSITSVDRSIIIVFMTITVLSIRGTKV